MSQTIFTLAGITASITLIILAFSIHRPRIIACNIAINATTLIQYSIAGATAGASMSLIALLYALIMTQADKFRILNQKWVLFAVLALYAFTYTAINWNNLVSPELLVLYGAVTSIFAMTIKNKQALVKAIQITGSTAYIAFSLVIGAYAQLPGQIVCLAMLILSLLYVLRMRHLGFQHVPELTEIIHEKWKTRGSQASV